MTRLLLASFHYPPSLGGVERQSHLLARHLVRRGHHVRVLSARLSGFARREVIDGVEVERIEPDLENPWRIPGTFPARLCAAVVCHRKEFDVVQVQQALYPAVFLAAATTPLRIPLVVRNAGSGSGGAVQTLGHTRVGAAALRLMAWRATGVALSGEMEEEMRSVGFRRIVRIPNAVEQMPEIEAGERNAQRQNLGLRGGVLLYLGRLDEEKAVDLMLDAWADADLPDATLLLTGGGTLHERVVTRVAGDDRLRARTRIVEPMRDVRPLLAAADGLILPSRSEGMSNALLEAMAAGLPVIATSVGGNREVIRDSSLGILVPPGQRSAMAKAMRDLFADPLRAASLGAAGRAYVREHHDVDHMVLAYERLYDGLTCG